MRSLAVALALLATPAAAQIALPGVNPQIQANQIQQQQQMQQMQVQQNLQNQQLQIQFQLQQQQQQMQREVQYGAQRPPTLHYDQGIAGPRFVSRRAAASARDRRALRHSAKPQRPKRRFKRRR